MMRVLIVVSLMIVSVGADSLAKDVTVVDRWHDALSKHVADAGAWLDEKLYRLLGGDLPERHRAKRTSLQTIRERDDIFFQTRKYLEETSRTYIRLRGDLIQEEGGRATSKFRVRAHLPLDRTRRRLRLFFEDIDNDNADRLIKKSPETFSSTQASRNEPKFGLNYFAPRAWGIDAKYSLGLSGLHPYVRARYGKQFPLRDWIVEPVQHFEYSEKYDFSEGTSLYFDTKPYKSVLLRFELHRGTRAHEKGMNYSGGVILARMMGTRSGVRYMMNFSGNTEYTYTPAGNTDRTRYTAPNAYTAAFGFRRTIGRRWLYLEATPAVNFRRDNGFHPDYSIRLLLDLLVGNDQ